MDYSNPEKSGELAALQGKERDSNPVNARTNANIRCRWFTGFDSLVKSKCAGVNCNAINGTDHSIDCISEHESNFTKE